MDKLNAVCSGDVALVTGAGGGFGQAVATVLVAGCGVRRPRVPGACLSGI